MVPQLVAISSATATVLVARSCPLFSRPASRNVTSGMTAIYFGRLTKNTFPLNGGAMPNSGRRAESNFTQNFTSEIDK